MKKCAYCGSQIKAEVKGVTFCKDGCGGTLFSCSCGALNRSMALWCRYCGRPVSYLQTKEVAARYLDIEQEKLDHPAVDIPLIELGIKDISDLNLISFSYGHMFILSKDKGFILNCLGNRVLDQFELLSDRSYIIPISEQESKELLIVSSKVIYKLDMVKDFHMSTLATIERQLQIIQRPVFLKDGLLVTVKENNDYMIKLVLLDGMVQDVAETNKEISNFVSFGSYVFFYNEDQIFLYDHDKRQIDHTESNEAGFLVEFGAQSVGDTIYAKGRDEMLRRIKIYDGQLQVLGLAHPFLTKMKFSVSNNKILMSHSTGVTVTDLLGQVEWSSEELLNPYPAHKFPPISFGKYVAFVMNTPTAEFLHIIDIESSSLSASIVGNFVYQPLFYSNLLFTIVEEDVLRMKVYML